MYVAGLTIHVCNNLKDCKNLMNTGFNNKHIGSTLMNKDSSRLTIY